MLAPGGMIYFSDIVEAPGASKDELAGIYHRLGLESMATIEFYTEKLKEHGMTKVLFETHTE